jgi:hypothetical protein
MQGLAGSAEKHKARAMTGFVMCKPRVLGRAQVV